MFTAAEYRLIRKHCFPEFQKLISKLNIPEPNWEAGNEFRIYEKLDEEIVQKICQLMKSDSIISGYTKFMTFGNLPFDYSETDNKLLDTILNNKSAVMNGATKPQVITSSAQKNISSTQKVTKHKTLTGALVLGLILIIAGLALIFAESSTVGGAAAVILGIVAVILGAKGKTVTEEIQVNSPQNSTVTTQTINPQFTNAEMQQIFDVLEQTNKVIKSI